MTNLKKIENIGSLDELIELESRSLYVDSAGQQIETFASYAAGVWANVIYGAGSEKDLSGKETDLDEIIFIIRFDAGLNQTMRILYNSIYYDIQKIHILGRQRYQKIYTKSRE